MKFEWDPHKEKINIKKHGVTFEQASYVFADPFALNKYDGESSNHEDRWICKRSVPPLFLPSPRPSPKGRGGKRRGGLNAYKATKAEQRAYQQRLPK